MTYQRWQDSSNALSKNGRVYGSPMVGMTSHSLAYEFTPNAKPSHMHIPWWKHLPYAIAHTLQNVFISES